MNETVRIVSYKVNEGDTFIPIPEEMYRTPVSVIKLSDGTVIDLINKIVYEDVSDPICRQVKVTSHKAGIDTYMPFRFIKEIKPEETTPHKLEFEGDTDIYIPPEFIAENSQHAPGAKLDSGKNRLGLVIHGFARALKAVGEVGTKGAVKYSPNGWMEVPNGIERYTDALYRHLLQEAVGEKMDKELDVLHAACTAWNALARLDLIIRELEEEKL